jgi:hypothetical protein
MKRVYESSLSNWQLLLETWSPVFRTIKHRSSEWPSVLRYGSTECSVFPVKMSQRLGGCCIIIHRGLPPRTFKVSSDSFTLLSHDENDSSAAFKVTRALVQALSNIVTANDDLISKLWELYMNLPEEQVILM